MLIADRGGDASLSNSPVAFTDDVGYKGGGFAKKSRRFTNLADTTLSLDQRESMYRICLFFLLTA